MRRALGVAIVSACVWAGAAHPAHAQTDGMPSEIEWKLAELGNAINTSETAKLYAPLQEKEPYANVQVTRDIKYGQDERNILDVFLPAAGGDTRRPVLIFVHGGGYVAGNKRGAGSPFYDNIMLFAARNGMAGVNMTYRLAPAGTWPSGAEDVAAVVRWVRGNQALLGSDPARIFLMGHSAGAVHVASYIAHDRFHGPNGSGLAGAILISGIYDIRRDTALPDYFGGAPDFAAITFQPRIAAGKLPLLVAAAELDPPMFLEQAKGLDEALCKAGRCGLLTMLPKHSHMSEVYTFNTPDTVLSERILAFVKARK